MKTLVQKIFGKKNYQSKVLCTNCNISYLADIPFGQSIIEYLMDLECDNCGCKKLVPN